MRVAQTCSSVINHETAQTEICATAEGQKLKAK
jgi:hypothetical protein